MTISDLIKNLLADYTLRLLRCAGETRLRADWGNRYPGYVHKHGWLLRTGWELPPSETGYEGPIKYYRLRRPNWMKEHD